MMSFFSGMLRGLRKDSGITQAQLAKEIGVSKSSINMYERGEREPSYDILQKISKYFNISADMLLGNTAGIEKLLDVQNSFDKALRDLALKHNLISDEECKKYSSLELSDLIIDSVKNLMNNKDIDNELRMEIGMEYVLATTGLLTAVVEDVKSLEDKRTQLACKIEEIERNRKDDTKDCDD